MFETIAKMLQYSFVQRAVIAGLMIAICAALLGVCLVLKRYSMIGDGLSHVSFAALTIATALNWAPMAVSIPVVLVCAFILLRISQNGSVKADAAVAVFSTGALAIGVFALSVVDGMNTDVNNYMFGSILSMTDSDVRLSAVLTAVVLLAFLLFYHKIFAVTFDETFAKATGVNTGAYNSLVAVLTALMIVVGMRMMGSMLISGLILFPALSAMKVCKKFSSVTVCAAAISVVCFIVGMGASMLYDTPTGSGIVIANMMVFGTCSLIGLLKRRI